MVVIGLGKNLLLKSVLGHCKEEDDFIFKIALYILWNNIFVTTVSSIFGIQCAFAKRKGRPYFVSFYSIAVLLFYLHFPNSIYSALFYSIVTFYFILLYFFFCFI